MPLHDASTRVRLSEAKFKFDGCRLLDLYFPHPTPSSEFAMKLPEDCATLHRVSLVVTIACTYWLFCTVNPDTFIVLFDGSSDLDARLPRNICSARTQPRNYDSDGRSALLPNSTPSLSPSRASLFRRCSKPVNPSTFGVDDIGSVAANSPCRSRLITSARVKSQSISCVPTPPEVHSAHYGYDSLSMSDPSSTAPCRVYRPSSRSCPPPSFDSNCCPAAAAPSTWLRPITLDPLCLHPQSHLDAHDTLPLHSAPPSDWSNPPALAFFLRFEWNGRNHSPSFQTTARESRWGNGKAAIRNHLKK
ncbi:hypothetical protein R3P38DRAFT_3234768 [Favolaschia claudopus]|uniref:Uncharacterized protein n=1 Tax=Favolaschia claudopus TaxID=2862362 RepID=A0AAV9ZFW5_9AGAR